MRLDSTLLPLFRGGPNQSYGYAVVSMDAMRQTAWGSPAGCSLIDLAGQRSAVAQGLKGPGGLAPVTKSSQLRERSTERLYVLAAQAADGGGVFVGLLKVGEKNLYHWDAKGVMHNLQDMPCGNGRWASEEWCDACTEDAERVRPFFGFLECKLTVPRGVELKDP